MSRKHFIISFILAASGSFSAALGQDIQIGVSTDSVNVGEPFFATVSIDLDAGYRAIMPSLANGSLSIGDSEFLRVAKMAAAQDISVTHSDSATYVVAVFGIDSALVGGLPVAIISPYGDTLRAASATVPVGIYSIVPEDAAGIKDLAPLATFPPLLWPWIVGGIALLAAIAIAYYIWNRRRGRFIGAGPVKEVRVDPYDEAVRRLRILAEQEPATDEEIRAYHIELSDTLRNYLEYTINVPALERTSAELMRSLRSLSGVSTDLLPEETVGQIGRSLDISDLAKFANYRPKDDENREVLDLTRISIETIEKARRRRLAEAAEIEANVQ